MKIKRLLANTAGLLETYDAESMSVQTPEERTLHLYTHFAVKKLKKLLQQQGKLKVTEESLQPFKKFLEQRWDLIANIPHFHYTRTYSEYHTKLCEMLATELAAAKVFADEHKKSLHRYQLLMPSLDPNLIALTMDLNQLDQAAAEEAAEEEKQSDKSESKSRIYNQVQLHHFILDENKKIIMVYDALESAREDGIIRHSSKYKLDPLDNIMRGAPLEKESVEKARVIFHSQESLAYHKATQQFWRERMSAQSAFGALLRLIESLYRGSVARDTTLHGKGDAQELYAGTDAYEGIQDFYVFFKSLSPADRKKLLSLNYIENERASLKHYLYMLFGGAAETLFLTDGRWQVSAESAAKEALIPKPKRDKDSKEEKKVETAEEKAVRELREREFAAAKVKYKHKHNNDKLELNAEDVALHKEIIAYSTAVSKQDKECICMKVYADLITKVKDQNKAVLQKIFSSKTSKVTANAETTSLLNAEYKWVQQDVRFKKLQESDSFHTLTPEEMKASHEYIPQQFQIETETMMPIQLLARNMSSTPLKLAKVLKATPEGAVNYFLRNIIGKFHLQNTVTDSEGLVILLKRLDKSLTHLVTVLGTFDEIYLKSLIKTRGQFRSLADVVSSQVDLRTYLGGAYIASIDPPVRSASSLSSTSSVINQLNKPMKRLFSSAATLQVSNPAEDSDTPAPKRQHLSPVHENAVTQEIDYDPDATQQLSPIEEGTYIPYPAPAAIRDTSNEDTQIIEDDFDSEDVPLLSAPHRSHR